MRFFKWIYRVCLSLGFVTILLFVSILIICLVPYSKSNHSRYNSIVLNYDEIEVINSYILDDSIYVYSKSKNYITKEKAIVIAFEIFEKYKIKVEFVIESNEQKTIVNIDNDGNVSAINIIDEYEVVDLVF